MVTNKALAAMGLVTVLLLALFMYSMFPRCEAPDEITVALTQLNCAQSMDWENLKAEACQKIKGTEDCEFAEEDREAIVDLISGKVNDCATKDLASRGLCTNNLPRLK